MLVVFGLFDVSGWLWAGSRGYDCSKEGRVLCAATVEPGIVSFSNLLGRLILMWTLK